MSDTVSQGADSITTERRVRSQSPLARSWRRFLRNRLALASGVLLIILLAALLTTLPHTQRGYDEQDLAMNRHAPTWSHPLGYDTLGRDLLVRCLFGGAISFSIGVAAAAISVTVGVLWGCIAGLAGGRVDNFMMRLVDILYGLPYILLVILMKVAFEGRLATLFHGDKQTANIVILFLAIGSMSWLTMARVIRGQVLSLREMPFVEAARATGVGPGRILVRHLLPNLVGPIIVYTTLTIPQAILQESFLSFLGIGVAPPIPTWGSLAAEGVRAINTVVSFWWMLLFPCLFLGLTLLALNFVGDGLRDAFDPRTTR